MGIGSIPHSNGISLLILTVGIWNIYIWEGWNSLGLCSWLNTSHETQTFEGLICKI